MSLQRILREKCMQKCRNHYSLSSGFTTLSSSSSSTSSLEPPKLPEFDYQPKPYKGQLADDVLQKRKKFLGPSLFHYYQKPLNIVEGKMQYLFDDTGRRYLDAFAGIVTVSCGHCHPDVLDAVIEQSKLLQHATTIYLHHAIADFAEALASKMPGNLKVVYFVNSGTEANELAMLMAKLYTGNHGIISLRNAYHGGSGGALGLTALNTWKYSLPQGDIHHVINPDPYRGIFGSDAYSYARDVQDHIDFGTSGKIAGFFAETIQGVGGAVELAPGYLKQVYDMVRKAGGVCIADEVQTGPTNSDSKGSVFACESYLPMFKLMRKLVRCNSLDKNIKIINKRSDELIIGLDIPAQADILVSEILDSELLGEGLIPTLQHAHDELLVQNPLTVPYRAIVYGQLLESSFLWKLHDLYNNDISASDAIRLLPPQLPYMLSVKPKQYPMHCDPLQHESKLLSEPFKIFEFDFSKRPDSYGEADIFINSTAAGTVNAVISWWVLQLDQQGTIYYSTAPKWIKHLQPGSETWCDHWKQCVWFVPGKGLSVSRDEEIHLHAVHSDISISYSLRVASQRTKNENSIRNDGFQLILPPEKIATYSDDSWRHSVLLAVQNAFCRKDCPLCFVADDSIFLATAIAHLCKTSRIMLLFPGLRERGFQYLQAIAETNQFSVNCMKLLDHRIDCMTMYDTDGKKIDVLVGEPFYLGSENYLPWRNLRFWKERTRLERILSKDVQVIPSRGILRVSAMFLPDLWRSRCSLVNIEGFNHSGANTILGACGNLPSPQDSPILPFFVWQSGETKELSERLTLMEFDFSKPMSSCAGKAKVDFTETGICHGFVLWIDWVLDEEDGIVISTGPDHRLWKQGVKLLRTPVGVGSRDNKRSDERHSVEMKASFDSTNGDLAIQYDFV